MHRQKWFNLSSDEAFGAGQTKKQKDQLGELLQYQASRKRFKNFNRRSDLASFFGVRWQMDVADLGGSKAFNFYATEKREKLYALIVVDLFSKYVFARALSSRKGDEVVEALKSILSSLKSPFPEKPAQIQSDEGGEFKNDKVKRFFNENGIEHKFEKGRLKDVVVERVIREFKKIAVLYLEAKPKAFVQWRTVVPRIANLINSKYNRSLHLSPDLVLKWWPKIQRQQIERMNILPFKDYMEKQKNLLKKNYAWKEDSKTFHLNQWVLVPNEKSNVEKETVRNYTYKPWKITSVSMDRIPFLYHLTDAKGNKAARAYYAKELRVLTKVPLKGNMPLAGILHERKRRGKTQWLVRFVDHESAYDKYINARKNGFPPPRDIRLIPKGAKPIKYSSQVPGARRLQNQRAYKKRKDKEKTSV